MKVEEITLNKLTVFTGTITRDMELDIRRQYWKMRSTGVISKIFGKEEYLPSYDINELIEFINLIKADEEILIYYPETFIQDILQALIIKMIVDKARISNITILTHSNHIINGVCVACRRYYNDYNKDLDIRRGINNEDVSIYFFNEESEEPLTIQITPNAKIINAPDGFLDQSNIDRKIILGFTD